MEWPQPRPYTEAEKQHVLSENAAIYRARLLNNRERVLELAVELLRYQHWPLFNAAP